MSTLDVCQASDGMKKFFERLLQIKSKLKTLSEIYEDPLLTAIYNDLNEIIKEKDNAD